MILPVLKITDIVKPLEVQSPVSDASNRFRPLWAIDPSLRFLNHGSYGAVPREVTAYRASLLERMERDAVRFYKVDLEKLMDEWRIVLSDFVGCQPYDMAPMPNATVAIATVLHNTQWAVGDEVVLTDHEYMSGVNELRRLEASHGVKLVFAPVEYPMRDPAQVRDAVLERLTSKTKMVMVSQITSATSLIFPVAEIVAECNRRGIETLIDGTHAVGQIPLNVRAMHPTYFVGSGHKWLSSPKGTGFLYVAPHKQQGFRPLALSSRGHKIRPERALFLRDFDYVGTDDYTKVLAMTASIRFFESVVQGGWQTTMEANHRLVMQGRDILVTRLARFGLASTAPDSANGTMTTLMLPEPAGDLAKRSTQYDDALQDRLVEIYKCVIPIWRLSCDNRRVFRISAQLYNTIEEYAALADALEQELTMEAQGDSSRHLVVA
jgi:isopenicillin-N epimerase